MPHAQSSQYKLERGFAFQQALELAILKGHDQEARAALESALIRAALELSQWLHFDEFGAAARHASHENLASAAREVEPHIPFQSY